MGRIRTVKPELPQQPWFGALSDVAARAFYGLLSLVDDCGRCPADRSYISGQIFWHKRRPARVIDGALDELERAGIIRRYTVRGDTYLEIRGWKDVGGPLYQQISKFQGERFPADESISTSPEGRGSEGKGSEANRGEGAARAPARSPALESAPDQAPTPTRMPIGWSPDPDSEANREAAAKARDRGVDTDQQLENLRNEAAAKGKTSLDWNASWRKWLTTAHAARSGTPPTNGHPKRDVRVGQVQPKPPSAYPAAGEIDLETGEVIADRPAKPDLVPPDAVVVDEKGNVRSATLFAAALSKMIPGGQQ